MAQRNFFTAVLVWLASVIILGQGTRSEAPKLPMARPEEVGMSLPRLARISSAMQKHVDRREIAGAVTLVARRGRVVHLDAVGDRDIEGRTKMTTDTIFRIRSMTKPIVSVAAMMLYEEGHFLLSDPISKWIPEFQALQVVDVPFAQQRPGMIYSTKSATQPVTVRDVLSHTSGLTSYNGISQASYNGISQADVEKVRPGAVPNDTISNFVLRLAKLPLNFEPGTAWQYAYSTEVVGRLIEIISGRSLEQFVAERILGPLQMRDTHFYLPVDQLQRLSAVYSRTGQAPLQLAEAPTPKSPYVQRDTYFSASGGLLSTAPDYFRFHQMMLNGGELDGVRLLGRKTVELMTANHTGDLFRAAPGMTFGLGYAIVEDVGASGLPGTRGMYTWPGSLTTTSFVDPTEEIVGVMMIQLQPRSASITNEFQVLAYQAITDSARVRQ